MGGFQCQSVAHQNSATLAAHVSNANQCHGTIENCAKSTLSDRRAGKCRHAARWRQLHRSL